MGPRLSHAGLAPKPASPGKYFASTGRDVAGAHHFVLEDERRSRVGQLSLLHEKITPIGRSTVPGPLKCRIPELYHR